MSGKSIIYGQILKDPQIKEIKKKHPSQYEQVEWLTSTSMFDQSGDEALVIVDLDNPKFSQPDFLLSLATAGKNVKIIGKAENPSLEETMRVAKLGVSEILSSSKCLERLHEFLESLEQEVPALEKKDERYSADALVGLSPAISEIRKNINLLSDVDYPSVLLLGDTGTGKSLIAKILHHTGCRSKYNLVEVNCSAIPDELFESELFGHTKGAFTDAKREKTGLFEYAQNGTIFLDEVGNLSSSAQAKLLKIVEDKKLRKVGAVEEKDINVRVVAATNLDLQKTIADGNFREDLYFRLNLLTIDIPRLNRRHEDIPDIVAHYVKHYSTLYGKSEIKIDSGTISEMQKYDWPGNIRELCNVIERAVLLNKSGAIKKIDIKQVLDKKKSETAGQKSFQIDIPTKGQPLREIEKKIVQKVLDSVGGNKSEAAKLLGISRPRLRRIMSGLEDNEKL